MELRSVLRTEELTAAEAAFEHALECGDESALTVLGYGEISAVVAVGQNACKRLPPFGERVRFEAYRGLFREYLEQLDAAGVRVVPSVVQGLETANGVVAYCVQDRLDGDRLGPKVLARASPEEADVHFKRLLKLMLGTIGPRLGLDGQLSNWVLSEEGWSYLDVTTPLLRDAKGRDRLDSDLFIAALPWALRGPVRRFVLRSITDTYFDPRRVVLDFLGNLHKERLEYYVSAFVKIANRHLEHPLTEREVRAYYADDARLWALLLALRRADRWWQMRVRRRPYPFLLPGKIAR